MLDDFLLQNLFLDQGFPDVDKTNSSGFASPVVAVVEYPSRS